MTGYTLQQLKDAPLYTCFEGPTAEKGAPWAAQWSSDVHAKLPTSVQQELRQRNIALAEDSDVHGEWVVIADEDEVPYEELSEQMDAAALSYLRDGGRLIKLPYDPSNLNPDGVPYHAWYLVKGCPAWATAARRTGSRWRDILQQRYRPNGQGYTRHDLASAPDGAVFYGPVDPAEPVMPEMVDEEKPGGWLLAATDLDARLLPEGITALQEYPGHSTQPQEYLAVDHGGDTHPGWRAEDLLAAFGYVAAGGAVVKVIDGDYPFFVAIEPPTRGKRSWRQILGQKLRPNPMSPSGDFRPYTKEELESAAPFTVFDGSGYIDLGFEHPPDGQDDDTGKAVWYGMFGTDHAHDVDVQNHLDDLGIVLGEHPEIDDDWQRPGYDDLDAALGYLASGGKLIKVPDAMTGSRAKWFRLYAFEGNAPQAPQKRSWRTILQGRAQ